MSVNEKKRIHTMCIRVSTCGCVLPIHTVCNGTCAPMPVYSGMLCAEGHVLAAQHMWRLKGAKLKGAAGGVGLLPFVCVGERDFCLRSTVSQGQCVLRSFP